MVGALLPQFAQHLFADRGCAIEFGCSGDDFTHLPLICSGYRRTPVEGGH
jgi:hypothetical protein